MPAGGQKLTAGTGRQHHGGGCDTAARTGYNSTHVRPRPRMVAFGCADWSG